MARFQLSGTDWLRGKVMKNCWVRVVIKEYTLKSDKEGADLHKINTVVLEGPLGSEEYKGIPVDLQFSEKAPGFASPLLLALGVPEGSTEAIDFNNFVGREVEAYNQQKEYQGRPQNNYVDFRAAKGEKKSNLTQAIG